MSKYKVLLPTNGLEVGSIVELEDSVAENYNAGEPTPRVEKVEESSTEPPKTEGEEGGSEGETDTTTPPESDEDTKTDEGENTGDQQ